MLLNSSWKKRNVNNFYTESKFLYLSTCQLHLGVCLMDTSNFTCFDFDPFLSYMRAPSEHFFKPEILVLY